MTHPIPTKLNLLLAALVLVSGTALLATSGGSTGLMLVTRAILYGLAMNTGYALIHEAEHGIQIGRAHV